MVLRLIRALPGDQALLSPLPRVISRNVTPALGRQNHTISPSASCRSSHDTPRPSHPASNVRDDREAPLMWVRDARMIVVICPTTQEKMCTTGSLRMAGMRITQLSPRHRKRTRPVRRSPKGVGGSNPESHRGCILDCFVAIAPRNDGLARTCDYATMAQPRGGSAISVASPAGRSENSPASLCTVAGIWRVIAVSAMFSATHSRSSWWRAS